MENSKSVKLGFFALVLFLAVVLAFIAVPTQDQQGRIRNVNNTKETIRVIPGDQIAPHFPVKENGLIPPFPVSENFNVDGKAGIRVIPGDAYKEDIRVIPGDAYTESY